MNSLLFSENFLLFSLVFWLKFVPKVFFFKNYDEVVAYIGYPAFAEFFQKELEEAHLTLCKMRDLEGPCV
jgi:hypothetical protein